MRRIGLLLAFLESAALGAQPTVVSYPRTDRAPARWTVDARPILEIGGQDGTGPAELTNVVGVGRQSSGTIIIADGTTRELRAFDARGHFLKRWARRGRGPGELPELDGVSMEGDTLLAIDGRQAVHLFAPDGAWLRSLILPEVPGHLVNPVFGSLSAVDAVLRLRAGSLDMKTPIRHDSAWIARVSLADSGVRVFAALPLEPTFPMGPGGRYRYPLGFAPGPLAVARTGRVCVAFSADYHITCTDSLGRALSIVQRDVTRRAVTDSARQAFRAVAAGRRPDGTSRFEGSLRAQREQVAAATEFAPVFPAISQLLLARTGDLWVRRYATEDGFSTSLWRSNTATSEWSIFDARGRWLADCVLPARFAPADMGNDWVIGVSRDADDVERVSVYRLRR